MRDKLLALFSSFTIIFIGLLLIIVGSTTNSIPLFVLGILFCVIIPTITKLMNIFG